MAFAALVLGIGLWHWQRPTVMAGSDIVLAHVLNEPETWSHDEPITYPQLRAVLAEFNLALNDVDVAVRYLHRCAMPGGQGLHIVLAKPQLGDLTLLIPPSGTVYAEGVTMREGFEASMLAVGTRKVVLVTPQHSSHQAVADWVRQQLTTSSGPTRS